MSDAVIDHWEAKMWLVEKSESQFNAIFCGL